MVEKIDFTVFRYSNKCAPYKKKLVNFCVVEVEFVFALRQSDSDGGHRLTFPTYYSNL